MRAWTFAPVALCIGLLAGCGDIEQINSDTDRDQCRTYGFTEGTDAFAQCMMRMDQRRARSVGIGVPPGPPPRNRDTIDSRPQFDRYGNPNFDTRGNYIGCHGIGCMVDNPDA